MGLFKLGLLALGLCLGFNGAALAGTPVQVETLAEGLDHPWNVSFLPDGRWLVTERAGRLRVIEKGRLLPQAVAGLPPIYAASQGGLFDALPAPDFASSGLLYLSFAHGTPRANATRVLRARLQGMQLTELTPIFTASPLKNTPVHYGARLAWLPDGSLMLTLGDGFNYREQAQKLDDHLGTIVRINADGSVPEDNPFVNTPGAMPEIYTYGNRNVQGLAVDADSGRIYAHEHGPKGGDEVNRVLPGRNYGWPAITYGVDYSGAVISPYTRMDGMEQPMLHWTPSIAPSDMSLYRGAMFAGWQGDLLVSSLVERSIRRIDLDADGNMVSQQVVYAGADRLRGVRVAPDGALIVLTDADKGKVLRLTPGQ